MNYYNENNLEACAWLRELIAAGQIPDGWIDQRSIEDVRADDLLGYAQCHFFAGIGGWALALRLAGWPDDEPVWTGSCPCQPLSCAGQRKGHADKRHLWPSFYRLISKRQPATVFGEQVAGKDGREWLAGVRADLEGTGYAIGAANLCAGGVSAPHKRQRLYWVANTQHAQRRPQHGPEPDGRNGQDAGRQKAHSLIGARGKVCAVANMQRARLEGHAGNVRDGHQPGRDGENEAGSVTARGQSGPVGIAAQHGCEVRPQLHGELRGKGFGQRREPSSVGDSKSGGCGISGDAPQPGNGGHVIRASWARFETVLCRDGKTRRFESGSFPLAYGLPGRVGLLRGYGNAIVPQLAAEFIQAACESVP